MCYWREQPLNRRCFPKSVNVGLARMFPYLRPQYTMVFLRDVYDSAAILSSKSSSYTRLATLATFCVTQTEQLIRRARIMSDTNLPG